MIQTVSEGKNRGGEERAWEELPAACVARNHQIDSVRGSILSARRTVVQEHRRHAVHHRAHEVLYSHSLRSPY